MTRCIARIAYRKLDITTEQWKHRPGFRVHCQTFDIALTLCGLTQSRGFGTRSLFDGPHGTALQYFGMLAPFREPEANELRLRVARHIKAMRRQAQSGQACHERLSAAVPAFGDPALSLSAS